MLSDFLANPRRYRKGVVAIVGAVVTVTQVLGINTLPDLSHQVLSVFDAICAVLVIVVSNDA